MGNRSGRLKMCTGAGPNPEADEKNGIQKAALAATVKSAEKFAAPRN
jgi:hypothetical protein